MKKRYIFFALVAIYLIITVVAVVYAINEEPESENSPTPTPTAQKTQCEADRDSIQEAIDAYNEANDDWPTANGQPGDIVWDKLVPQYMSAMPLIDGSCDWRVSGNPEGAVCVAHTC